MTFQFGVTVDFSGKNFLSILPTEFEPIYLLLRDNKENIGIEERKRRENSCISRKYFSYSPTRRETEL